MADEDGVGDVCDSDMDGDGAPNNRDEDIDGDGFVNEDDNCPYVPNPRQQDTDEDGIGNVCDPDMDGDGTDNTADSDNDLDGDGISAACDNCPDINNTNQADVDEDGSCCTLSAVRESDTAGRQIN